MYPQIGVNIMIKNMMGSLVKSATASRNATKLAIETLDEYLNDHGNKLEEIIKKRSVSSVGSTVSEVYETKQAQVDTLT